MENESWGTAKMNAKYARRVDDFANALYHIVPNTDAIFGR